MLNFHKPNKELLMYGLRPCAKNHTDMQGRIVRRHSGACWACCCSLPEGKFNYDFGELKQQEYKWKVKYNTDEEKRQARVEAQMRWNERNKDKFRSYQKKYESKPEIIEKRIVGRAEYYQTHKEEHNARQKAYYQLHREEILEANRIAYKRKKDDAISKKSQSNTISGVGGEQIKNSIS